MKVILGYIFSCIFWQWNTRVCYMLISGFSHDYVEWFVAHILRNGIIVPERDAVNKNCDADDWHWDQHKRIKLQPGEIQRDSLSVVIPEQTQNGIWVQWLDLYSQSKWLKGSSLSNFYHAYKKKKKTHLSLHF